MKNSTCLFSTCLLACSVVVGTPSVTNATLAFREVSASLDVSKKAHFRATEDGFGSGEGVIADVTFVYSFDDAVGGGDLKLISGSYTLNTSAANPGGMGAAFDITGTLNVDKLGLGGGSNIQIVTVGSAQTFLVDLAGTGVAGSAGMTFGNGSSNAAFSGSEVFIDQDSGDAGQGGTPVSKTNTLVDGVGFDDRRFTFGIKLENGESFSSFDLADVTDSQHNETKLGFFWAGEENFVTNDDFGVLRGDKNVNATGKNALFSSFTVTAIPEPGSFMMLGMITVFLGISGSSRKLQR